MTHRFVAAAVIAAVAASGFLLAGTGGATALYFPPPDASWEHVDPAEVGWDAAALENALDWAGGHNTSGVVILHRGRILAERRWELDDPPAFANVSYRQIWFHGTTEDGWAIEDVASAQKSIISILAGIAVDRGLIDIEDPVSKYLGAGWSAAPPEAEAKVLVRHLLSMSAGLSETKLELVSPAGEKWAYINKAYSLVNEVVQAATGREPNDFMSEWVTIPLGMSDTRWIVRSEFFRQWNMNGLATTAPDLARFGLMVLARGTWNGRRIVSAAYLKRALSQSHPDNPSYGFLWWLNNPKGWRWVRGEAAESTNTSELMVPAAPPNLVAALGSCDRKVYVVPSLGLVVTRTGTSAKLGEDGTPLSHYFDRGFWDRLMKAAPK
jgi:CubicO group peptidase (beta-lactamase class C family)